MSMRKPRAMGRYNPYIGAAAFLAKTGANAYKRYRNWYSKSQASTIAAINSLPREKSKSVKRYQKRYRKNYQKAAARKITRINPAIKQLDKKVKQLVRSNNIDKGVLIYRNIGADRLLASQAQCAHFEWAQPITLLETVMDQLRWYNPATNAFVTADASGAQFHKIHFATAHYSIVIRNNYQVPCKVTVYTCVPKVDTNITVATSHSDWATDNLLAGAITDPTVFITDSDEFNELYRYTTTKKVLEPGQEFTCSYSSKPFDYDSGYVDSHALSYQADYGSMSFYIRIEGMVGHDSSADEQAYLPCGVDFATKRTYKVVYDAGVKCKFVYSSVTQDLSFVTGGLISNMPMSDNQGYSVN